MHPIPPSVSTTSFVIGGVRTIEGPIVCVLIFWVLLSNLSQYNSLYLLILGVIAIAMMLFLPKGIWGGAVGRKGMQLFPTHRYLIRDE